jgi:hypothetical protein
MLALRAATALLGTGNDKLALSMIEHAADQTAEAADDLMRFAVDD